jgi:lysophospholipase L1-like esterase
MNFLRWFTLLSCLLFLAASGDAGATVRKKKDARPPHKSVRQKKVQPKKKGKAKQAAPPRRAPAPARPRSVPPPRPEIEIPQSLVDPDALSPVAIEMAPGTLAPFFRDLAALDSARAGDAARVVRVLHLGDSHVAADYWSGEIRRLLQQRFGDAGVGYVMPGRPWKYFRHAIAKTLDGEGWKTVGLQEPPPDGVLGLSGTALIPGGNGPASVQSPGRYFEVSVAAESDSTDVRLLVDGAPFKETTTKTRWINSGGRDVALLSIANKEPLEDSDHKLSILLPSGNGFRLLGAEFTNGRSGIILDTLGLNGGRMTALEKWSPRMRRHLLAQAKPSLVIVSYGTNEIGANKFTYEGFRADCVRVLRALREDAGGAPVLVTGPIDRAGKKNGEWVPTTEAERPVIRALREAAAETGCAFWDAQAAIGGEGAMFSWMREGLAQPDGVHLTQAGYERQGRMLFDRLMAAYGAAEGGTPPSGVDNGTR